MGVIPALVCGGLNWSLSLDYPQATFQFGARTEMEVMHQARPQEADWPVAMTLIGARDSAILILEDEKTARLLTQRGQTPLLLVGTCQPA